MIQFDWYFSNGLKPPIGIFWVAFLLVESSDPSFHLYFPLKVTFTSFVSDEGQPFFRTDSFRITCCFLTVKLWTFSLPIVLRLTFTGCLGVVFCCIISFPKNMSPKTAKFQWPSKVAVAFGLLEWFLDFLDHRHYDDVHPRARARQIQMENLFLLGKYSASSVLSFRKSTFCWLVSEVYSDCMHVHTCTCYMFWFIWVFPKIGIP